MCKAPHSDRSAATEIGIPLSPDKCVGPTIWLGFLGIELDVIQMTARLPADKRTELTQMLDKWATKRWCTLKELQSLVGKLNHAFARAVVPQDRTFVYSSQYRFIRLNIECRDKTGYRVVAILVAYIGRRVLFWFPSLVPNPWLFHFHRCIRAQRL